MSPVPIYTPGRRETKGSKVPCLRKQRDGRGLSPGPPDPEFKVLTTQPHMPPRCVIEGQPKIDQHVRKKACSAMWNTQCYRGPLPRTILYSIPYLLD